MCLLECYLNNLISGLLLILIIQAVLCCKTRSVLQNVVIDQETTSKDGAPEPIATQDLYSNLD